MPKIKNTGTCVIDIAGVLARPNTSVDISDDQYEKFAATPAGKGLLSTCLKVAGDSDITDAIESADIDPDSKEALLEKAKELGLKVNKNYGEKRLKSMIDEAEAEADTSEEDENEDEDEDDEDDAE